MKIQVWRRYVGNRASEPIEVGEYDCDDNHLYGAPCRYLIDNGNAHEIVEIVLKQRSKEEQDEYLRQHHESLITDAPRKTRSDKGKPRPPRPGQKPGNTSRARGKAKS